MIKKMKLNPENISKLALISVLSAIIFGAGLIGTFYLLKIDLTQAKLGVILACIALNGFIYKNMLEHNQKRGTTSYLAVILQSIINTGIVISLVMLLVR